MLLVGLLVPIPTWILHRRWPKFGWNAVFTPTLVAELGFYSVGINSGTFMSFVLAIVSQWYLRKWVIVSPFLWSSLTYPLRYRPRWFRKYNFLLSAALDGGTQVMVFVYSFAVGGASGTATPMPNWALVSSENKYQSISAHFGKPLQNPTGNPDYCDRLSSWYFIRYYCNSKWAKYNSRHNHKDDIDAAKDAIHVLSKRQLDLATQNIRVYSIVNLALSSFSRCCYLPLCLFHTPLNV